MSNPAKEKLAAGEPILGVMVTIPSVQIVEVLVGCGVDYIVIDMEHSPISIESVHNLIVATRGSATSPTVRLPTISPWLAKAVLDSGACGVLFPHIRSPEDAATAVSSVRYHPAGQRGWGPYYAHCQYQSASVAEYTQNANEQILAEMLVEDIDGFGLLRQITAVPGVDIIALGQSDLAMSMGHGEDHQHPEVQAAMRAAEETVMDSGVVLGGRALNPEDVGGMLDRGYRYITMDFDFRLIERACRDLLRRGAPLKCGN